MKITSSSELVNKALREIKTISTEEAHTMMNGTRTRLKLTMLVKEEQVTR